MARPSTSSSAPDIRAKVARITGLPLRGVVQAIPSSTWPKGARAAYRIGHGDGVLVCVELSDGWNITLAIDDEPHRQWETTTLGPEIGRLIQIVLDLRTAPVFEQSVREIAADIARKDFRSDVGLIRLHTRRRDAAVTEVVIEVVGTPRIIRLLQDRRMGGIDLNHAEALSKLPF